MSSSVEDISKGIVDSSNSSIIIITHNGKKISNNETNKEKNLKTINNKDTNDLNSHSFINSSQYAEDIYNSEKKNSQVVNLTYEQLIGKAREEFKSQRYNDSLDLFNQIIQKFPNEIQIEPYRGKALSLAYTNKINEALKFTENEIKSIFSEKEMLNIKSEIYFINKDYDNSLNFINKSLKIDINNEDSLVIKLKILYYMKSNRNDILDCLNKIQKINKNNPSAFYYLGKISQDEEKYEKAIELYIQSLENHYKNIVEIYENLGICYQKINEYKEALIYYEKYSIYIPKDVIYYKMGLCSLELKLYNKANEYFTMCITLNNRNVEAMNYKGICYVNLGIEKKAERNFLKAIETDCNFHKAYLNLIKFYVSKRKYDDAKNILKIAFKRVKLENDSEDKEQYICDLENLEELIKKEREEYEQKKDCNCQGCNIF